MPAGLPPLFISKSAASIIALAIACLALQPGASAIGDSRAPLMAGLDRLGGAKPLEALGLNVYGYAEGGYFYDASAPASDRGPTFIGFNGFKNTPITF